MNINIRFYTAGVLITGVLGIYVATLAPGLTFIDSGELAAVCATLGIAHPTGYPLYTLLGWLWVQVPLGLRPVLQLNLMSALLAGCGLYLFFWSGADIFLRSRSSSQPFFQKPSGLMAALSLGCGTLLLAFSRVFWSVALVNEVYALQGLFVCLLMFLSIRTFCSFGDRKNNTVLTGALFFSLGLSFCNHMSTVLFIPALVYLMVSRRKTWQPGPAKLMTAAVLFLVGLAPYLYLPIRALQLPQLNWGNPQTWQTFFWHIAAKQYRVWMFSSFDSMITQLTYFIQLVLHSFGYLPILLIPFGIWFLYHLHRPVCWFTVVFFLSDVVYSINYDIKDIDAYFLPAFVMCALWMSSAVLFFLTLVYRKKPGLYKPVIAAVCVLACIPLFANYTAVDQSSENHVERYVSSVLQSLEPNALILSYQWDYFCSPLYYLQLVEAVRPDVTMIEVKLLKRSWYLKQLEHNYPELMKTSQPEITRYERELYKFEHDQPYDAAVIQKRYMEVINSFISKNIATRPVYLTCEQEKEIGAGLLRVPEGLVFRLYPPGTGYRQFDYGGLPFPSEGDFTANNLYHTTLKTFYAFMLTSRALYELNFGNRTAAGRLLQQARAVYADYPLAARGFAALQRSGPLPPNP